MSDEPLLLLNIARPWGEEEPLESARIAHAAGFHGVGFADSPRLFPDSVLETDRVLSATDVRMAGPCVLGLGLHHPAVVAQSIHTLAHHYPGRVLTVVGRGESSVRNEGMGVPRLAEYEAALDLLGQRLAELGATEATVLGAASGPRTLIGTARRLRGVLIDAGADVGVITRAVSLTREANADIECWLFLRVVTTSTRAQVEAAADPVLGSCAARLARAPEWFAVPPNARAAVARLADAHDYRRHGTAGARGDYTDPETETLVRDRFLITGTAQEVTARLGQLAGIGLKGVVLAGAVAGLPDRLPEVADALRAGFAPREECDE